MKMVIVMVQRRTPKREVVVRPARGSFYDLNTPSFRTCSEVAGIEGIQDRTETNLVNLRRVIYLTIMNSLTYEEAVHKLMKVNIQEGQEVCTVFSCYDNCRLFRSI